MGVYVDIHVGKDDHPLPFVSDDRKLHIPNHCLRKWIAHLILSSQIQSDMMRPS